MKGLNGKSVTLDLQALNQLCGKCLHDLDELESRLNKATEKSYPNLPVQLLTRRALLPRVAASVHYA